jgi:hypothetical protein
LGKFGAVELSDVSALVELPDGKVLSGSETGELLLWDGGLIKVVLQRPGKKPCHDGQVSEHACVELCRCVCFGWLVGNGKLEMEVHIGKCALPDRNLPQHW